MENSRPFADLTVLVVDDDRMFRTMLSAMLRRLMMKAIVEAENGDQALQLFRAAPAVFDLVVCDWNMPGLSGMEVCQQVRVERPGLPFLMVTGRSDLESVKTAKQNSVSAYVLKPFSPNELKNKVGFALQHR
jgi:two-component system chemotaxis response regulator CheY